MNFAHRLLQIAGATLGKKTLSTLIYHQVLPEFDPMRPEEPTPESFRWHMRLISQYMTPISLTEAVYGLKNQCLPANAICVTFDDGYENNLSVAEPILRQFNVPATVYVATGFSNGTNMFNDRIYDLIGDPQREHVDLSRFELGTVSLGDAANRIQLSHQVIKKTKYLHFEQRSGEIDGLYADNKADEYPSRMMTPAQIRELSDKGVEIGAHTHDHPILRTLDYDAQVEQIRQSKTILQDIIDKPVKHFAYPNGKLNDDYSLETVEIVKQQGFDSAVSTHRGVSTASTDRFQLQRFLPWDKRPLKFHTRLLHTQVKG